MTDPATVRPMPPGGPAAPDAGRGDVHRSATAEDMTVVTAGGEASYLGSRIRVCQQQAEQSRDSCARRVHLTMAERYRARLEALSSRRP